MGNGKLAGSGVVVLALLVSMPGIAGDKADIYRDKIADEAKKLSPDDLSDEQLERYVKASRKISSIRLKHADEIAAHGSDAVRTEAQEEMAAVIEDHGLTVRGYREIAHWAHNDGEISQRIKQIELRTR